jgi:redox-sensitive bicupin YhaK (pirin superfamily)
MMDPRYQEISIQQTPTVSPHEGVTIRVVCGSVSGIDGPVKDIIAGPEYFDISMEQDVSFSVPVKPGYTALAYVIGGKGHLSKRKDNYPE